MPHMDENTTGVIVRDFGVIDKQVRFDLDFDDRPRPQGRGNKKAPEDVARMGQYATRTPGVKDPRIAGSTWTKVKPNDFDIPDRHELFLLGDGEKKVEMETVTRKYMHESSG